MEVLEIPNLHSKIVLLRKGEELSTWKFDKNHCEEVKRIRVRNVKCVNILAGEHANWIFVLDKRSFWTVFDENFNVRTDGKFIGLGDLDCIVSYSWAEQKTWNLVLNLKGMKLHYLLFFFHNGILKHKSYEFTISTDVH